MSRPRKPQSFRQRLIRMQLGLAAVIVSVCSVGFAINSLVMLKSTLERNLRSTSQVLSRNLELALSFSDPSEATKTLGALEAEQNIATAYLFDRTGKSFARYGIEDPTLSLASTNGVHGFHLLVTHPIMQGKERLGLLVLKSDLRRFFPEYLGTLLILGAAMLLVLVLARIVAEVTQRFLSAPIAELADTARRISEQGNYSIRVKLDEQLSSVTELETLAAEFNRMLEQVEGANRDLERRVDARTTELKDAQTMLMQTSKLSALGEMAAGIAHEINNPLGIIHNLSGQVQELVAEDPIPREDVIRMCATIEDTTQRIARIVAGLRTFARDGAGDPIEPTSIKDLIEQSLALCQEKFKNYGVKIDVRMPPPGLKIECRPTQVGQVLVNLLNNAYDAIEQQPDKWIRVLVEEDPERIRIRVIDCGSGVDPAVLAKLFQPFFTTKPIGKGTGIGLPISKGICQKLGGDCYVDVSSPNTCFVIELPRHFKESETVRAG